VKRSEIVFVGLIALMVPPILYLMSSTTRYENNEITCVTENDIFKLSYETLSIDEIITFEQDDKKIQLAITEILPSSFSFVDDTKTYKINLESDNALVIEDGVNEIFNCEYEVFKM
tara:strand:+ start:165 stop:512 length:348 start_codon:yes stop_codon:yes gene_type:complete